MGVIPKIQVFDKKNPVKTTPGLAGKIAVIGAFAAEDKTEPILVSDLDAAYDKLGQPTTENIQKYKGIKILDKLFYGASSILAVDITRTEEGTEVTTITTEVLDTALAKIKHEKFDMLFIADTLTDAFMPLITGFADERYLNKMPIGYMGAASGVNLAAYTTTAGLQSKSCYGIVTQPVLVNNVSFDLLEFAAYYCGVVAALNVGASMTAKQVPGVTGLTTSYTFEDGDLGEALVGLGYTVIRCYDREEDIYEVVNSEQFSGYDLYVHRVRDYVIREFALHNFLGDRNNTPSLSVIQQEVDRVKNTCIKSLNLLKDIEYNIEKKSAECVAINLTKLLFDGVITEIDMYVTIEVQ